MTQICVITVLPSALTKRQTLADDPPKSLSQKGNLS